MYPSLSFNNDQLIAYLISFISPQYSGRNAKHHINSPPNVLECIFKRYGLLGGAWLAQ